MIDCTNLLKEIYEKIKSSKDNGKVVDYIPELAKVNPDKLGVCMLTNAGIEYGHGDWQERFSIQSIAKVFSLTLAYSILGVKVWERVGVEPSGTPFNSLTQLESDCGIPRNPFNNGGAIVVCDMLISHLEKPKQELINFIRNLVTNQDLNYSEKIAKSEALVGYRNKALCYFIKSFGNIKNDPEEVLDLYFHLCSIEMSCQELTRAFRFLADTNFKVNGESVLTVSRTKRMNAIMQTCGFYDESGEFAFEVGLPGKSGVGGGIVAIYPNKYSIAVWSPKLNKKGNSDRGMKLLELLTTESELSIF